jgi:histidinol dehydrogenase/sulfopropanediol 3-dehydrogenase
MPVKVLKAEQPTTAGDVRTLQETVAGILGRVRERGDAALRELERELDRYEPPSFRVTAEEAAKAAGKLPPEIVEELDFAITQVTAFAQAQKASFTEFEREIAPGMRMGHRLIPVDSCGCYVPAGRYPCLTSAVMSVAPAKVAGVKRIVACSPPGPHGGINLGILYTMYAMGVDEIYCFGGAQAIGALAHGTETIAPVDLIVGPGNQWVTEAKRQVFGTVGIDFLAGPSECLVLADDTADAELVAADLLARSARPQRPRCGGPTSSGWRARSASRSRRSASARRARPRGRRGRRTVKSSSPTRSQRPRRTPTITRPSTSSSTSPTRAPCCRC